jgi:hypothetical protein
VTNSISCGERRLGPNGFGGRSDGEIGVDDNCAGTRDAPGAGALGAERVDAVRVAQQCGIPVSTLSWWRRVYRGAEEAGNDAAVANAGAFTEVPQPAKVPRIPAVVEIILHSGHVVRVPAGADTATLQRVLQALARSTC